MYSVNQIYNVLTNFIFAYVTLIGFILSLGLSVNDNHKKFISNPIILIISSYFFLGKTIGSPTISILTIIIFYLSTLYIVNDKLMYKKLLGDTLGDIFIDLAEELGILEVDPTNDYDS